MSLLDAVKAFFKTPAVDPVSVALRQAFCAASDACEAPFSAVDPYTDRANYLSDLSVAERERERERYNAPFYTQVYLDAHTAAIGNLTAAFDALTAAFAAWNPDATHYPLYVELYKGNAALYRLAADAYHNAARFAARDAAAGALQALKDTIRAEDLEFMAANPSTTNPIEAKEKATAAKAKAAEDTANAEVLKQRAEAATETAQVLFDKAKAAEAKAEEALEARQ